MKWYNKSLTVLGIIIAGGTELLAALTNISPELEKLGTGAGLGAIFLGIRRALERLRPEGK